MSLPVITCWVVIVNTSSEVDEVSSISGPYSSVVTHSDVEEEVVLLVEDITPSITFWSGFCDSFSVVGFTFSIDTDELRVITRINLNKSVTSVVFNQGPTFLDVISIFLNRDITSLKNAYIIFRIDSPDNSFFSRGYKSLSSWNLFPRGSYEAIISSINTESLEDFIEERYTNK